MMGFLRMFSEMIFSILLSCLPNNSELALCPSTLYPLEAHVDGFAVQLLDGVVGKSSGS
jgi:hypothetical protein